MLGVILLGVIMLGVNILGVIILGVNVPSSQLGFIECTIRQWSGVYSKVCLL